MCISDGVVCKKTRKANTRDFLTLWPGDIMFRGKTLAIVVVCTANFPFKSILYFTKMTFSYSCKIMLYDSLWFYRVAKNEWVKLTFRQNHICMKKNNESISMGNCIVLRRRRCCCIYIFSFHFVPFQEREEACRSKEPPEEFQQGASPSLPGSFWAPFRPHQPLKTSGRCHRAVQLQPRPPAR